MTDARAALLSVYEGYTEAFQLAYERFVADDDAAPDATDALPYYHAPCMFITPAGVEVYETSADLARYFEQVMLDMRSKRYLRTGLGTHHVTFLGPGCALLSLEVTRFDRDGRKYDGYGVTYTFYRDNGRWQIAVVNTHPKAAVIRAG